MTVLIFSSCLRVLPCGSMPVSTCVPFCAQVRAGLGHLDPYFSKLADGMVAWIEASGVGCHRLCLLLRCLSRVWAGRSGGMVALRRAGWAAWADAGKRMTLVTGWKPHHASGSLLCRCDVTPIVNALPPCSLPCCSAGRSSTPRHEPRVPGSHC